MSFDRIVGHAAAVGFLRSALASGKLPHALLFSGPAGVGKRLAALETAKALLCARGKGGPCDPSDRQAGACDSCSRIDRGLHPDVALVAPNDKQNVTIGDVRALIGLQAAVLLASREPVAEPSTRTYTVLDQAFTAPADGRQRRVVTLAHAFRSRIR